MAISFPQARQYRPPPMPGSVVAADTRLPLLVEPPTFDLGSVLEQAGAVRGNELQNEGTALLNTGRQTANAEGALRLEETQATKSALDACPPLPVCSAFRLPLPCVA